MEVKGVRYLLLYLVSPIHRTRSTMSIVISTRYRGSPSQTECLRKDGVLYRYRPLCQESPRAYVEVTDFRERVVKTPRKSSSRPSRVLQDSPILLELSKNFSSKYYCPFSVIKVYLFTANPFYWDSEYVTRIKKFRTGVRRRVKVSRNLCSGSFQVPPLMPWDRLLYLRQYDASVEVTWTGRRKSTTWKYLVLLLMLPSLLSLPSNVDETGSVVNVLGRVNLYRDDPSWESSPTTVTVTVTRERKSARIMNKVRPLFPSDPTSETMLHDLQFHGFPILVSWSYYEPL